jgi:hypothetical protein
MLFIGYVLLGAALSWTLGQDVNWDLRNYHFYNPYQLIDGRFDRDFQVAGLQTFFNPALDLPFYVAVRVLALPPLAVGLGLGAFHGIALWVVHRLTVLLLPADSGSFRHAAGVTAALVAAFGAGFHSEIGSTMGDATISVAILAGLAVLMVSVVSVDGEARVSVRGLRLAGALAGIGAGAKLVGTPYALGLVLAAVAIPGSTGARASRALNTAGGVLCGMMLTGGYWMIRLSTEFGNPVFPHFNDLFRSPFAPGLEMKFWRTLSNVSEFAVAPLLVSSEAHVSGLRFNDGRIATAYISMLLFCAAVVYRRWRGGADLPEVRVRLTALLAFSLGSFLLWRHFFRVYRYLIPLELLGAVTAIACCAFVLGPRWRRLSLAAPLIGILFVPTVRPDWGRLEWGESYFGIDPAPLQKYRSATVLLYDMPDGYFVPFFPGSTRFIRMFPNWRVTPDTFLGRLLIRRLHDPAGVPDYLFEQVRQDEDPERTRVLASLGLFMDATGCEIVRSRIEARRICPLHQLRKAGLEALSR